MAAVTFAQLVRARQAALTERMDALELLREIGEVDPITFGREADRLSDELAFLLALADVAVSAT